MAIARQTRPYSVQGKVLADSPAPVSGDGPVILTRFEVAGYGPAVL